MKRRKLIRNILLLIFAFIFGYSIKKEGENLILQRLDSTLVKDKNRESITDKIRVLMEQTMENETDLSHRGLSVYKFGAKGDGVTDDTHAIQKAIDYIQNKYPDDGGDIIFGSGVYKFTQIKISGKHIRLLGMGTLKGSILIKSVESMDPNNFSIKSLYTIIQGLHFQNYKGNKETDAITIQNTRDVSIINCHFENYRYAIFGEPLKENFKWQQTARVRIESCTFSDCIYMIYTKWFPWHSNISSDWVYHQHGDWTVRGCYFYDKNSLCVDMIHMEGQDGLICNSNYFFHGTASGKSATKKNNLYIKQSNFVIISENNFFEAGCEGIKCEDTRTLTISNNNIARCGQRLLSSAILVEVSDKSTYSDAVITISNNTINGTTQHGIYIGNNIINALISGNNLFKEGESTFYYGTKPIESISHYSIYIKQPKKTYSEQEQILIMNNLYSKPLSQERGTNINNGYLPFVKANNTFGNVVNQTRIIKGSVSIAGDIHPNNNPFNNNFPFIFKGWEGTLSKIIEANPGQIISIVIINPEKNLLIKNSTSGSADEIVLKGNANRILSQFEPITLQKSDSFWLEI